MKESIPPGTVAKIELADLRHMNMCATIFNGFFVSGKFKVKL